MLATAMRCSRAWSSAWSNAPPARASDRSRRGPANLAAPTRSCARRTGVRGETYAYWYLRRHGYISSRAITLARHEGRNRHGRLRRPVLAFIEVKTRAASTDVRLARRSRQCGQAPPPRAHGAPVPSRAASPESPCRFDVLAIETRARARLRSFDCTRAPLLIDRISA